VAALPFPKTAPNGSASSGANQTYLLEIDRQLMPPLDESQAKILVII